MLIAYYFSVLFDYNFGYLFDKRKKINEETDNRHTSPKKKHVGLNLDDLPPNLGLRLPIFNDQDKIRRTYLQRPRCQSHQHNFPSNLLLIKIESFH